MGTPHKDPVSSEALAEIDTILATLAEEARSTVSDAARTHDAQQDFRSDFMEACRSEVRPAMEVVLERLIRGGGGGLIDEHPGGEARYSTPRLTLWMSLQGAIAGAGRPDRHPYLQLDADLIRREVRVTEGDMWRSGQGHSGGAGTWLIADLTRDRVTDELLSILRRSARTVANDHESDGAAV